MANHPNRSRGRPSDPDAKKTMSIALRPSHLEKLAARNPAGWRARVAELIEADIAASE